MEKLIIFLIAVIGPLFLDNIGFGEQLYQQDKNGVGGFFVYGNKAQDEIIPSNWKREKLHLDAVPSWLSKEDKETGYLVFRKSYLDLIYLDTLPKKEEKVESLEIFATQGEYEPITFCIKALEDLKGFEINIDDLINKEAVIGKPNIDVRVVRYFPQKTGSRWPLLKWQEGGKYRLSPLILEKMNSLDINKGLVRQYWMTIYIPEDAVAGDYFCEIILQADGKPDKKLNLKVKVLPFKLKNPDRVYGVYYHIDSRWKGFYPFNVNKHFVDMREHGLNSVALYVMPYISTNNGGIELDFVRPGKTCVWGMDDLLEIYKNIGFDKRIVYTGLDLIVRHRIKSDLGYEVYSKGYDRAFASIVKAIRKEQAAKNWPEFLFSPSDEPVSSEGKMEICKYYLQLLKETLPDSKTYLALIGKKKSADDGELFDPWLDIRCYNFIDNKIINNTREAGDELWVYNGGSFGKNPSKDRFFYGFYAEKILADGIMQWVYQWPRTLKASPYNEMQYGEQGWYYTYPSVNGPLPTIGWEGLREGIDDAKYVSTLRCFIDEAKESNDAILVEKATEAEELIKNILKNIKIDFHARNKLDSLIYDKWRWEIACKILELQKLLKAGTESGKAL